MLKFTLLIVLICVSSVLTIGQVPDKAKVIAGAERAFEKAAKTNPMPAPGCAVGVSLNGESVFEKAFGLAEMEFEVPNSTQTVFEAASISKQFTAAAFILLQQDGKLKIDDPVRKYIPELPEYDRPVTIRHMLNHTAGLRDWGSVLPLTGHQRFDRLTTNDITFDIIVRQKHLDFIPGTEYSYTNSGYQLAVVIIERVSKKRFSDFVSERIFKPLGMTKSTWKDDHRRIMPQRAQAYTREGSPQEWMRNMRFTNVVGASGLHTTIGDLLKWNASLDARTFGEPFVKALETQGVLADGRRIHYALGISVGKHEGFREVYHDGQQDGYRSYLARFPDKGLSFAVLCNTLAPDAIDIVDSIFEETFGPFPEAKEPPFTVSEKALRKYVGLWKNEKTRFTNNMTLENGRLKLDGQALTPVADGSFAMEDRKFKLSAGSPLTAEVLEFDESVTRLTMVPQWTPTKDEIAIFAGEWRSEEAQATVKIALDCEKPSLVLGTSNKIAMKPTLKDHFSAGIYVVWFSRSARGKVNQMHIGRPRLRDMRFERSIK